MAETVVDEKVIARNERWQERIAEHADSGMSVRRFCKERGIAEHLFFYWRKRLRNDQQPVRFALVEKGAAPAEPTAKTELELVLVSPANGYESAREWMPRLYAPFWKPCEHDPPAGQRAGVSVLDAVRHAQEL